MINKGRIQLSLAALAVAAVVVGVALVTVLGIGVRADATKPVPPGVVSVTIPTWPAFSMVYETDGAVVSVGSDPAQTIREVHQLDYQSKTQWRDTVLEAAPSIQTSVGEFSRVGSYVHLDGDTYTEFNAMDGAESEKTIFEETIEKGTTRLAGPNMHPFPIEESGIETTATSTTARVCFQEKCTDNAQGLLYRKASGSEKVFVDDARGIPLRVDNKFIVREPKIDDERQPFAP